MNWGKKLLIAMLIFISFIVFLATRMILSNNDDLISKNYYEEGLNYDQEYNARKKALQDSIVPQFVWNDEGLNIVFPCSADYVLSGKFLANSAKDKTYRGKTDVSKLVQIPANELDKGEWQFDVKYFSSGQEYFVRKQIIVQ